MDLAARWASTVAPWGGPPHIVAEVGADLLARYSEPHRRYHTATHLRAVVDLLFLDLAVDPDSVALAAWFHDAVYDPRAPLGANEEASAALAATALAALGAPPAIIHAVPRLVMTTVDHVIGPEDADGAVLADADLAILGASPEAYRGYVAATRDEYGWLTADEWRVGRSAVLEGFLARPRLYATDRGGARWELAARHNLGAELASLLAQA